MTDAAEKRPRILWGAKAIGETIGVGEQKAFYLLKKKRIPARKVGDEWTAEEGELLAFFRSGGTAEAA